MRQTVDERFKASLAVLRSKKSPSRFTSDNMLDVEGSVEDMQNMAIFKPTLKYYHRIITCVTNPSQDDVVAAVLIAVGMVNEDRDRGIIQ